MQQYGFVLEQRTRQVEPTPRDNMGAGSPVEEDLKDDGDVSSPTPTERYTGTIFASEPATPAPTAAGSLNDSPFSDAPELTPDAHEYNPNSRPFMPKLVVSNAEADRPKLLAAATPSVVVPALSRFT